MTETDQPSPPPESGDIGRAFILVDRGNVDAEIERLAGPGGGRESDWFVVVVPVPPPARASLRDPRKSGPEMQKVATE
jgi:hypothetical protein